MERGGGGKGLVRGEDNKQRVNPNCSVHLEEVTTAEASVLGSSSGDALTT